MRRKKNKQQERKQKQKKDIPTFFREKNRSSFKNNFNFLASTDIH